MIMEADRTPAASIRESLMQLPRRAFLHLAASAVALSASSSIAWAQAYPARPVRWIVGYAPGGAGDIIARLMGQWLSERLGQPFIIENKPGAGSNLATEAVAKAAPDGYTLLLVNGANAVNATLYDHLNFNFIRDIAPVASIMRTPSVMEVSPTFPVTSVAEFIAYAKANPGKLSYATQGVGTSGHVNGELFKMMAGIDMIPIHYRSSAPALTDLLGGQVQVMFDAIAASIEQIRAGRLRALAVTSAKRLEVLPQVPPVSDFLPGYEASNWQGMGAPTNTPAEVIERLNREINTALADPAMKVRIAGLGSSAFPETPADFGKFMADETEKWGKVVRAAHIKAE
jgi:tripartite-type tricarboxylate transporter receptor subunit TctC